MEQLGLTAVDCLAFEDSANGFLSSTIAGIKTLVTVNGYTRQQDFDGAAIVLDKLGEPEVGFTVIAGDACEATYVDVPFIKRLFA
jgi:beta-phosphoglucomutase-like phosphatase (HAD superfamily)